MLAVMFVVGMTIGGVVFPHQSEPTQISKGPPRSGAKRID
jgi:hypothetical protein